MKKLSWKSVSVLLLTLTLALQTAVVHAQALGFTDCTLVDCRSLVPAHILPNANNVPVNQHLQGIWTSTHFIVAWGRTSTLVREDYQVAAEALEFALVEFARLGYPIAPFDQPRPRFLVAISGTGPGFPPDFGFSFANVDSIVLNQARFANHDFVIPTAAHELFHVLQFRMRPLGFWEPAAMLATEEAYPEMFRFHSRAYTGYLTTPQWTLHSRPQNTPHPWAGGNVHHYGSYLFLRFLDQDFTSPHERLGREMITTPGTANQYDFYRDLLWSRYHARLPEVFSEFAARNSVLHHQQGWLYQEMLNYWMNFYPGQEQRFVGTVPNRGTGSSFVQIPTTSHPQHLAYNSVSWPTPNRGYWNIQFDFDANGSQGTAVNWYPTVVRVRNGRAEYFPVTEHSTNVLLEILQGDSVTINTATWAPGAAATETFGWRYRVRPYTATAARMRALVSAQSTWQGDCNGAGRTSAITLAGTVWITEHTLYESANCTGEVTGKLRYVSDLVFKRIASALAGYSFKSKMRSIELTLTESAVPLANIDSRFGYSDWQAGIPKAIFDSDGDLSVGNLGDEFHGLLNPNGDTLQIALTITDNAFPTAYSQTFMRTQREPALDSAATGLAEVTGLWTHACRNGMTAQTEFSNHRYITTATIFAFASCSGDALAQVQHIADYSLGDFQNGDVSGWPFVSTLDRVTVTLMPGIIGIANQDSLFGFNNWAAHVPKHVENDEVGIVGTQLHGLLLPEGDSLRLTIGPIDQPISGGETVQYQRQYAQGVR